MVSPGGGAVVQFVRQTPAGELEPVSVTDAAVLFSRPGTSYQVGATPEGVVGGVSAAVFYSENTRIYRLVLAETGKRSSGNVLLVHINRSRFVCAWSRVSRD